MPTTTPDPPTPSGAGRVTIADIARELGISKAAVSYTSTGRPGVGAHVDYETQARVPKASFAWYRDLIASRVR